MKLKNKKIKCEVCDMVQEYKSAYPDFQQHTMLVVSVFDAERQKRKYMDFCSIKCLCEWANDKAQPPRTERVKQPKP